MIRVSKGAGLCLSMICTLRKPYDKLPKIFLKTVIRYFVRDIVPYVSGVISKPIDFMGSVFGTRSLIGFMNFLMWFGNTTIMLMAAVMGISTEVFEAADLDGCNALQRFFYITLPSIRPILAYTLITSIIGGLQMFDVPQILTNGQGNPDRSSMTLIMFLNNHLKSKNYGMAGTLSVYLFIVSAILCFIVYRMTNDSDPDGSKAAAKKAAKEARRKKKEAAK